MAHEVFISYSSKDQATADLVCEALEARGIRCWIASRDIVPGSVWLTAIVEAIDQSRVLVFILSANANQSVQVLRELERAVHKGVALLPFRIEPVPPSGRMEHLINVVQWLQAYPPPVERHLAPLILAVQWLLKQAPEAAAPAPAAPPAAAAPPVDPAPPEPRPAPPHNLPAHPTPLLGRERECEQLRELLRREAVRLVTLSGPGGMGKTRLGLQIAADLLHAFCDGVCVIELAPLTDPQLVASTIAQTLGVRESAGQPLLEALKEFLREKQMLLLLDNFEQVGAAAPQVAELLARCPRLKAMITSREALRVRGEFEFSVPPLALPDRRQPPPLEELTRCAAVQLFSERACAVKPDFALTDENAPAVAEICHRLDGLPLAIELAAARVKLLPPQAMLARLERRLKLLDRGPRDLPERHQTLRGAIAWSWDLLEPADKRLFRRLAVFVGGSTLEAAEAVCNPAGDREIDLFDGIESLVNKHLLRQVTAEQGEAEPRFGMLETIREFAGECLAESGEEAAIRREHARFFLALAEQAEPRLWGAAEGEWLDRLETEHDNLRAALGWAMENGEAEIGLRLGAALRQFWHVRGYLREGRERLEAALSLPGAAARSAARAPELNAAGALAHDQGDLDRAARLHEESLAIARACGDPEAHAYALLSLGNVAVSQERFPAAKAAYEQALALWQKLNNQNCVAQVLNNLAGVALGLQQPEEATALLEQSLALKRQLGNQAGIATTLNNLGLLALDQGDHERAAALFQESLGLFQKLGHTSRIAEALNNLARLAAEQEDLPRAACLLARVAALSESLGALLPADSQRTLATARAGLSEEAFTAAWARGQAMTLDEAIAHSSAASAGGDPQQI